MRIRDSFVVAVGAIVGAALSSVLVFAWTGPTQAAPDNGTVAAPVNVGSAAQSKNGSLDVNSFAVFGDSLFSGLGSGVGRYLNFDYTSGATSGTGASGYGIRDNAGTMEYKNRGGAWAGIGASSGGYAGPTVQVFTANGTWTKPVGVRRIKVTVTGGGGGGGPGYSNCGNDWMGGAGGGAGGTAIKYMDVSAIPSVAVTVGTGGTGAAAAGCASYSGVGGNGGSSSFGAYASASGGASFWGGGGRGAMYSAATAGVAYGSGGGGGNADSSAASAGAPGIVTIEEY